MFLWPSKHVYGRVPVFVLRGHLLPGSRAPLKQISINEKQPAAKLPLCRVAAESCQNPRQCVILVLGRKRTESPWQAAWGPLTHNPALPPPCPKSCPVGISLCPGIVGRPIARTTVLSGTHCTFSEPPKKVQPPSVTSPSQRQSSTRRGSHALSLLLSLEWLGALSSSLEQNKKLS